MSDDELRRRHQEAEPYMLEHDKLMDSMPYPHAGWALCSCKVARKIREILEIPEKPPAGNIPLTLEDFGSLVRGEIVVKQAHGKQVKIALQDIGHDKMLEAVVLASRFK